MDGIVEFDSEEAGWSVNEDSPMYDASRVRDFTELRVWNNAMKLAVRVYEVTRKFPPDERYGLTQQIQRCAVSIPSNIAEGQSRGGPGDFSRFLGIARGSAAELRTQLLLGKHLGYGSPEEIDAVEQHAIYVSRQLTSLRNAIRKNTNAKSTNGSAVAAPVDNS